jgi:hypothetical protein
MSAFAGLLVIAAQAVTPALVHERTFEPIAAVEPVPTSKSIWRIGADGAATHAQSTLHCPAQIGAFKGGKATVHDGFGLDVSCSFDLPNTARITLFLTKRSGQSLQDDFNAARAAISGHQPDRDLAECAAAVLRNGTQIADQELTRRLSLIAGMSEQAGTGERYASAEERTLVR